MEREAAGAVERKAAQSTERVDSRAAHNVNDPAAGIGAAGRRQRHPDLVRRAVERARAPGVSHVVAQRVQRGHVAVGGRGRDGAGSRQQCRKRKKAHLVALCGAAAGTAVQQPTAAGAAVQQPAGCRVKKTHLFFFFSSTHLNCIICSSPL